MDTPRTDKALSFHYSKGDYFGEETTNKAYDFARELERELNKAIAALKRIEDIHMNGCDTAKDKMFMGEICRAVLHKDYKLKGFSSI